MLRDTTLADHVFSFVLRVQTTVGRKDVPDPRCSEKHGGKEKRELPKPQTKDSKKVLLERNGKISIFKIGNF